jgi:hypothetical protein
MFKLPSGQRIGYGEPFTVGDTQYPGNWLSLVTREERAAIGITEIVEQTRPDDRYYWVTENDDGSFTTTPKDIEGLRAQAVAAIKATATSLLAPTDWIDIRNLRDPSYKPEWMTWRESVRATANAAEAAVKAAKDVDALIALPAVDWGHDPDYVEPAPVKQPSARK